MNRGGQLFVTLTGGQLDGDSLVLVPNGSVGPPHALEYFSFKGKHGGFDRYEAEILFPAWPQTDCSMKFNYTGFRPVEAAYVKNKPMAGLGKPKNEKTPPPDEGEAAGV